MGLDSYFTKKIYVGAQYEHRNVTGNINIFVGGKKLDVDFSKVSQIEEAFGYWRKANAIHRWFVESVQDGEDNCKEYLVDEYDMKNLLALCNKVLEESVLIDGKLFAGTSYSKGVGTKIWEDGKVISNPEIADALLPTGEGFFFGGTGYDEWYIKDLEYTKELMEKALACKDGDFYYSSSW
ncbi:MAG: hypothetical protein WA061_02920 [Microgenomates group bacterium]